MAVKVLPRVNSDHHPIFAKLNYKESENKLLGLLDLRLFGKHIRILREFFQRTGMDRLT